jgi:hypothetical protein
MRAHQFTSENNKQIPRRNLGGFSVKTVKVGSTDTVDENRDEIISSRQISVGRLVDLTKQFPSYQSLIGQIKEITEFGKVRIQIVQVGPGNRPAKHRVGDVISIAPNYISKGSVHETSSLNQDLREEIKLNAPHKKVDRKKLHAYLDRIKSGTKTKQDKFEPIIHGSNIKAITKSDNPDDVWDLDDLSNQITTRPRSLLGTNAKMEKSKTEGEIIYDLTLPAISGIVVDEATGDFVEITTCPGAGECQLFCYARKGGYVIFPASSMSAAQSLNFLVNDPKGYSDMVNREIETIKKKADKHGIGLVVRWHDAGDFFSKEYLDLAFDVARSNPDVQFYAYTKMGDVATSNTPPNFVINFSSGAKSREVKKVEIHRDATKQSVKQGVTVPKDTFYDLIAREGIKLIKDEKGRTQFKSPQALEVFKDRLAKMYKVDPDSIITYDQMLNTPIGNKPHWNVIVQPGAGDRAANRRDVINSFLMYH